MSARNRAILTMRKLGMSYREIARGLDVTVNVVAGVLHRSGMTPDKNMANRGPDGPRYGHDTKREAVELLNTVGWRQASEITGINWSTIHRWRREFNEA